MAERELAEALRVPRPRTRAECLEEARPCPWFGCRHHLALEVVAASGCRARGNVLVLATSLSQRGRGGRRRGLAVDADAHDIDDFADAAVDALLSMQETCALDVAAEGDHTSAELAEMLLVDAPEVARIERKVRTTRRGREEVEQHAR